MVLPGHLALLLWCEDVSARPSTPLQQICDALSSIASYACSSYIDPNDLTVLVACKPIVLDKFPGTRPTGIGEMVYRIISKAILSPSRVTSKW